MVQMGPSTEHGRGDAGWIYVKDRELDGRCSDSSTLSTVNIHNDSGTRWVEIGWHERWDCYSCSPKTKKWNVFIEGRSANGAGFGHIDNGPAIPGSDVETWDRFKINDLDSAPDTWQFFWMKDAVNGSYQLVCNGIPDADCTWEAGFQGGYAFGETEIWRSNGNTGARSHLENLKYKDCGTSCSWDPWQNNLNPKGDNVGYDHIDGFEWHKVANDEYTFTPCQSPC